MFTTAIQPSTPGRASRTNARRAALACAAAQAAAALLLAGPAEARVESPQDTRGGAVVTRTFPHQDAPARVTPTRVAGLDGVHVNGGWLLR